MCTPNHFIYLFILLFIINVFSVPGTWRAARFVFWNVGDLGSTLSTTSEKACETHRKREMFCQVPVGSTVHLGWIKKNCPFYSDSSKSVRQKNVNKKHFKTVLPFWGTTWNNYETLVVLTLWRALFLYRCCCFSAILCWIWLGETQSLSKWNPSNQFLWVRDCNKQPAKHHIVVALQQYGTRPCWKNGWIH